MLNLDAKYILNTKINTGLDMKDVLSVIENKYLTDGNTHYVCTTNPEFIMLAQQDKEFLDIINNSDLSLPDGAGVLQAIDYLDDVSHYEKNVLYPIRCLLKGFKIGLGSFKNDQYVRRKIRGVELVDNLCQLSSEKRYSVFLLGGRLKDKRGRLIESTDKDIAELAAQKLTEKYPGINIIGASSKFHRSAQDDEITLRYIKDCMSKHNTSHLDFLFVAYEQGHQEKWIVRNAHKINAKVSIGVGSTLDYMAGTMKYSPNIYNRLNLEWLYKLITQPWRLKRIINAFPLFPFRVFIDSLQ
ncbi:WecB/TagA/CpsF family glycosyltransferase [candidate division WWE3 bacterium]|jgi:N-acetylglucosaminyldiphosphoundecaprenol N-acetyl-beta-D-mannosaminyltransferase|uniref:WecB/TagA/CpsF family glycosyltransferase n=1 Tax=candidate division WWE3 bacterium TaxID=2053526 RepID=A0A3A4ZFP4_UNCKA|nr:MAG: WecB/TagA/CpsF family glycosyltransferase [candidate division WWE3 bacterium]